MKNTGKLIVAGVLLLCAAPGFAGDCGGVRLAGDIVRLVGESLYTVRAATAPVVAVQPAVVTQTGIAAQPAVVAQPVPVPVPVPVYDYGCCRPGPPPPPPHHPHRPCQPCRPCRPGRR